MTSHTLESAELHTDEAPTNWVAIGALVLAILSFLFSGFRSYTGDTQAVATRVTAIETKQTESEKHVDERLKGIEHALERFEGKLDRLVERR